MSCNDVASTTPDLLCCVVRGAPPLPLPSYHRRLLARSLASALPNCWIDTQMMASGTRVSSATTQVAAGCHILIVVLSKEYLT
jgi:hypothetical protein